MAGGLGERLRPFTQAIPRPLLPIGEQSLVEIQIANLARHGFGEIFIATNYKSERIENFIGDGSQFNVRIRYSRETRPLGTCGPLALLRRRPDSCRSDGGRCPGQAEMSGRGGRLRSVPRVVPRGGAQR